MTAESAAELIDLENRLVTLQLISVNTMGGEGLSPAETAVLAAFPDRLDGWTFPVSWSFYNPGDGGQPRFLELTAVQPLVIITLVEGRQSVAVGGVPVWRDFSPSN